MNPCSLQKQNTLKLIKKKPSKTAASLNEHSSLFTYDEDSEVAPRHSLPLSGLTTPTSKKNEIRTMNVRSQKRAMSGVDARKGPKPLSVIKEISDRTVHTTRAKAKAMTGKITPQKSHKFVVTRSINFDDLASAEGTSNYHANPTPSTNNTSNNNNVNSSSEWSKSFAGHTFTYNTINNSIEILV